MTAQLLDPPLPVRLRIPDREDRDFDARSVTFLGDRLVVCCASGEGYHWLPHPYLRDRDGVIVVSWELNQNATSEWARSWTFRPRRSVT